MRQPLMVVAVMFGMVHSGIAATSSISVISSRSDLSNPQTVNWSQLGPAGTQITQPFQISADGGFPITVYKNNSNTKYLRADEGNGFLGDFSLNEPLLFSTSLTAIDIIFSQPVWGVGANAQLAAFPNLPTSWQPFVLVKRSDGPDVMFTLPQDTNDGLENGTAPFVGILSTGPSITEVLFDSFHGGNTAINNLSIMVPEPCSVGIMSVALVGFLVRRRRSRA